MDPMTAQTTHDFTSPRWAGDFVLRTLGDGTHGRITGWGLGLKVGDFVLLPNGDRISRFRVDAVGYGIGQPEMFSAEVSFAGLGVLG
jgi:hypothetical protein